MYYINHPTIVPLFTILSSLAARFFHSFTSLVCSSDDGPSTMACSPELQHFVFHAVRFAPVMFSLRYHRFVYSVSAILLFVAVHPLNHCRHKNVPLRQAMFLPILAMQSAGPGHPEREIYPSIRRRSRVRRPQTDQLHGPWARSISIIKRSGLGGLRCDPPVVLRVKWFPEPVGRPYT